MHDKRVWTIGAALLTIVLLLGGYFLGVAPQLEAASQADSQRVSVQAQNDALSADIAVLKRDYDNLDTFRAELDKASLAVPDSAEFASYISQLNDLAVANTVSVLNVTVSDGKPYTGPVNALALELPRGIERQAREAAAKAALTGTANDVATAAALEALTKRAVTAPVESSRVTPQNFVAIPVTIDVSGDYDRLLDYVAALQNGTRLTLVNTLTVKPNSTEAGSEGEPAPAFTANISAYVYVLINAADAPADPAAAAAAAAAAKAEADALAAK